MLKLGSIGNVSKLCKFKSKIILLGTQLKTHPVAFQDLSSQIKQLLSLPDDLPKLVGLALFIQGISMILPEVYFLVRACRRK